MSGPVMDAPPGWTRDAAGNWVQTSPAGAVLAGLNTVMTAVGSVANPARLTEASTYAGAAIGVSSIGAGDIESLAAAAGLLVAGDIPGAINAGAGPLLRLGFAAAAILIPDRKPTDDAIKTAVAGLTHEQLISLLDQSITINTGPGVGAGGGAGGQTGSVSNTAG